MTRIHLANWIFFSRKSATIPSAEQKAMQSVISREQLVSVSSGLMASAAVFVSLQMAATSPVMAQRETWLLGPGSSTGKESKVVPTDCVENADGSVTCDTKIENPSGDTPARPSYQPFTN